MEGTLVSSALGTTTGTLGIALAWGAICVYSFAFGTVRVKALALSLPIGMFLFSVVPASILTLLRTIVPDFWVAPILFVAMTSLSFFVVQRGADPWDNRKGVVGTLFASTALSMLLLVCSYTIFSPETLAAYYPSAVETIFGNSQYTFWIASIALVLLYLL